MNSAELFFDALAAGFLAYRTLIFAVVAGGCALAAWGAWRGRRMLVIVGLVAAVAPGGGFILARTSASDRMADRLEAVADMERHPLPREHPRLLHVEGQLDESLISALLSLNYFDEARAKVDQSATRYFSPVRNEACTSAARRYVMPEPARASPGYVAFFRERHAARLVLKDCSRSEASAIAVPPADAVVLRIDADATLRPKTSVHLNGAVEIVLRENGAERLIEYRERPFVERPARVDFPIKETVEAGERLDAGRVLLDVLERAQGLGARLEGKVRASTGSARTALGDWDW